MPVNIQWDNADKTIIRFEFVDPWTWKEFYGAIRESEPMHNEVDHMVFWLYDINQMRKVPPNSLGGGKQVTNLRYENTCHDHVIVGANSIIRTLGNTFNRVYSRLYDMNIHFAESLEEGRAKAHEFLEKAEAERQSRSG
ncbi:MAG: hypothetical protein L0154_09950 [Chloroflexi bacterium]|nr:hypothetical protein [Chloroflexota bacterium]